jgi:phage terminase large subunit-like protein
MNEPRKRNDFLRLELNVWTEAHSVWISPESWDECRAPAKDEELAPLDAVIGFDLSTRVDLTAVVVTFRRPDLDDAEPVKLEVTDDSVPARVAPRKELLIDFAVDVLPYFFMPKGVLEERVKKDQIPYDLWRDEGWLRVTEGDVTDTREVYRFVMQDLRVRFPNVREIAYDDWHAQDIASNLIADGAVAVPVRQGFRSLSAPSMLLEALVRSKRLRHDGNPVMRWCVSNCQVATDPAGNIKPVKPGADARSTRRIDGVVATVTALNRLMVLPRAMRYEGNGVQWIDL